MVQYFTEKENESQFYGCPFIAQRALPTQAYHFTEFKLARVNIDYHIEYDKHYYSAPHHLVKHPLEIQATRDVVRLYFKGKHVATHARSHRQGAHSTNAAHMPQAHQKHNEWSPGRLLSWSNKLGPNVTRLVKTLLEKKQHPEQAYRACLGLLNLSRNYEAVRLDKACERALTIGSTTVRSVKSILEKGLDQLNDTPVQTQEPTCNEHDNVRGAHYYH